MRKQFEEMTSNGGLGAPFTPYNNDSQNEDIKGSQMDNFDVVSFAGDGSVPMEMQTIQTTPFTPIDQYQLPGQTGYMHGTQQEFFSAFNDSKCERKYPPPIKMKRENKTAKEHMRPQHVS